MDVLAVHNYYQQRGGEDQVFESEIALLEKKGHRVSRYTLSNSSVVSMKPVVLCAATLWNQNVYRQIRTRIQKERPRLIHVHNTFPLISPSVYYAAKAENVPVVQTLHNYRILCPNALFFRNGNICEDCLGRAVPWPGVAHSCYRGSRVASATVATLLATHRLLGTWKRKIDLFIALTEFAREKFIGFDGDKDKIVVKPNFVENDPGVGLGEGGFALFVGRLSPEKGIETLLSAWDRLKEKVPLRIIGDGPLSERVSQRARHVPGMQWLGAKPSSEVYEQIGKAAFVVVPSESYETFGRVIIEAFAKGTPVIASNIGAIAELIENGRNGLYFRPGDPKDLANKVEWLQASPATLSRMRDSARAEYVEKYTADRNYTALLEIYERVQAGRR